MIISIFCGILLNGGEAAESESVEHKHLCQDVDLKVLLHEDLMFLQFVRFDSRVDLEKRRINIDRATLLWATLHGDHGTPLREPRSSRRRGLPRPPP